MSHNQSNGQTHSGLVYKKTLGNYYVNVDGATYLCSISTLLRRTLLYPIADPASIRPRVVKVKDIEQVDPVAVGDIVEFVDGGNDTGMITTVLPRKSRLTRRAAGRKPLEQIIVANVDQVVAVFSAALPSPKWSLLDRYLASSEACEVPALICITKLDLVDEAWLENEIRPYREMGYPVLLTSVLDGRGMDELAAALQGKLSVLVGKSGVGKSSLLNTLQPGLGLRVNEVNAKIDRGRHTTTHLEMFPLDIGGSVVDTPGIKVFGLWNVEPEDMALLFRDMAPYVGTCRFGLDCTHEHEPGCAIKAAVQAGNIHPERYANYLYIREHPFAED